MSARKKKKLSYQVHSELQYWAPLLAAFCLTVNINFPITVVYKDLRFVIRQRGPSTIENQRAV